MSEGDTRSDPVTGGGRLSDYERGSRSLRDGVRWMLKPLSDPTVSRVQLHDHMNHSIYQALVGLRDQLRSVHGIDGHLFFHQIEPSDEALQGRPSKPRAVTCLVTTSNVDEGTEFAWSRCPNLDLLWSAQGSELGSPTTGECFVHESPENIDIDYHGGVSLPLRQGKLPPHRDRLAPDVAGFLSFYTEDVLERRNAVPLVPVLRTMAYHLSSAWTAFELAVELAALLQERIEITIDPDDDHPDTTDLLRDEINRLERENRSLRDDLTEARARDHWWRIGPLKWLT